MGWLTFFILWLFFYILFEKGDSRNVSFLVKVSLSAIGAAVLTISAWLLIKLLVLPTWLFLVLAGVVAVGYFLFRKSPAKS